MKKIAIAILSTLMLSITSANAAPWYISPKYDNSSQFSEGFANVSIYTAFINRKGETVYRYPDNAPRFSNPYFEGISIGNNYRTGSSNEFTLTDKSGNSHIISGYSKINNFHNGFALIGNDDRTKYGYINKNFEVAIPIQYSSAKDFNEGFAAVRNDDGKWGFIETNGTTVIDFKFNGASSFYNGLAAVKNSDGLWGYIDYSGEYVILPAYLTADDFSNGAAVVKDFNGLGIIDENGNLTYLTNITGLSFFSEGVMVVQKDGKYALIDKSGSFVTDFIWDYLSNCNEGIITGIKDGICYIMNNKCETIYIIDCDDIKQSSENLINAQKDGLWGYIANPLAKPSPWAENTINNMFDLGYMTSDTAYNYQNNITRAEFCDILVSVVEKKTNTIFPVRERTVFDDTTDINISKLVNAGITDGVSETEFAPNDYLTREQAAKIFAFMGNNFIDWEPILSNTEFIDDEDISDWAYKSVYLMRANGIIEGYEDGGFRPYIYLTKEQAIAMLYRFIDKF